MAVETRFFYTNSMEIATSPFDIGLKFMRNGTDTPTEPRASGGAQNREVSGVVLEAILVSMSLSHAKAMMPALVMGVLEYEKKFGTIPVTKEISAKWDNLLATLREAT